MKLGVLRVEDPLWEATGPAMELLMTPIRCIRPRNSRYLLIKELGPAKHNAYGLEGLMFKLMIRYLDPLGDAFGRLAVSATSWCQW